MPFQPAIEEPSKKWPSVNLYSSKPTRHRHVLFLAAGVGEAEVDELHLVVLTILITSNGSMRSPQTEINDGTKRSSNDLSKLFGT